MYVVFKLIYEYNRLIFYIKGFIFIGLYGSIIFGLMLYFFLNGWKIKIEVDIELYWILVSLLIVKRKVFKMICILSGLNLSFVFGV